MYQQNAFLDHGINYSWEHLFQITKSFTILGERERERERKRGEGERFDITEIRSYSVSYNKGADEKGGFKKAPMKRVSV